MLIWLPLTEHLTARQSDTSQSSETTATVKAAPHKFSYLISLTKTINLLLQPKPEIIIINIITKIYIAHYRIAPNALIVSVRSSE